MANKNKQKIFISLVIGVLVSCVSLNTFSTMQKQIKEQDKIIQEMKKKEDHKISQKNVYVTVIRDIPAGEAVSEQDIMLTAIEQKYDDAITEKEKAIGKVLLEPVKPGQILTNYLFTGVVLKKDISLQGLQEGYRALTLSTSALEGLSSEMKQGSYVDIFSKSKSNKFILSKVKILSLEPTDDKKKDVSITQASTVTFEVRIDKIEELVEIYSSGKILLVMRPVGDDTVIVSKKKQETIAKEKKSKEVVAKNSNIYGSTKLPELPIAQAPLPPPVKEVPVAEVVAKKNKIVEVIEANNKKQINFD